MPEALGTAHAATNSPREGHEMGRDFWVLPPARHESLSLSKGDVQRGGVLALGRRAGWHVAPRLIPRVTLRDPAHGDTALCRQ